MKVLQINAVNKIGSTGRNCYETSEYILKNGGECVTAFSSGSICNPLNEFVIGDKKDIKIHGLLSRISGKQGYFSVNATSKLIKYIGGFAPDVVLLGNLHGNYINLPMLLEYLAKNDIPTVAVLHDCWFYTGKCCHYTVDGCYKWQESCGNCPSLKKYNKSWFFDKTSKMLEDKKRLFNQIPRLAVVGVSDWIANEAKIAPVFKNAKEITRIYNWIDLKTFYPRETATLKEKLGLTDKKVILCVAAGWNNEKGLQTIIKLSEKLADSQRLIIVGNIPADISFNDRTIHLDRTDNVNDLAEYYSLADVFVQPSLEETFGKVSAEALACGTPIVCFDSTANPELVGEGCGQVVPVGDVDGMYEAVNLVSENDKGLYSKKCIDFARQNFDKETNIKQYISLFERLLNDHLL